jgi:SHS2 domain-containing protein
VDGFRLSSDPDVEGSRAAHAGGMGYEFVEHVGEVELELSAPSRAGIFDAAAHALAELLEVDGSGEQASEEIVLEGGDPALLLVDWLNELVFLAESKRFVPESIGKLEVGGGSLKAAVRGRLGAPRHLVKAVTLNRLMLEEDGGEWHGRVVLDV